MGISHLWHLFVGRKCSPDESRRFFEQLKDMADPDPERFILLFNDDLPEMPDEAYFTVEEDASHRYVVVCDRYDDNEDEVEWYVVQSYVHCFNSRYPDEEPIDLSQIPQPFDARYGLMGIYDVSC